VLGFGDLFHFEEDHGGDFLGREFLPLAEIVDFDEGCTLPVINERKGPLLAVFDDIGIIKSSTNKTSTNPSQSPELQKGGRGRLCVEDGVFGVECGLILCGVTDETLAFGEGDVRGRHAVSLVIGNDLNIRIVCPDLSTKSALHDALAYTATQE
jgi:hypothetical protein